MTRTAHLVIVLALATLAAAAGQPAAAQENCMEDSGWLELHETSNGAYAGTLSGNSFNGAVAITPVTIVPQGLVAVPQPFFLVVYVDSANKASFRALVEANDQPISKNRLLRRGQGEIISATGPWEGFTGGFSLDTKVNLAKYTQKGDVSIVLCGFPTK